MSERKRLLLIDLSGLFWPLVHVTAGEDIDAAYRATMGAARKVMRGGYDYTAICCDGPGSWRKELEPTYKANRPPKDEAMVAQLRRVQEELKNDGQLVWLVPRYEADDLIATATRWATNEGLDVTIATGDKDLCQLVRPSVSVVSPRTGDVLGPVEVEAKFGVRPDQIADWLSLMGDASDNIKGIDGVGAKTAAWLLASFGDMRGIDHALERMDDRIKPALRQKLIAGERAVQLARKLVELKTDAPIDCKEIYQRREPQRTMTDSIDASFDDDDEREAIRAEAAPQLRVVQAAPAATVAEPPPQAPPGPGVAKAPAAGLKLDGPSTALAVAPADVKWALEPTSTAGAYKLAQVLHQSRFFGAYGNPEGVLAVILAGRSMGLDAMTALRGCHIVEGKVILSAQLMIALCLRSGVCEYFELVESTDERASYETKRAGGRRAIPYTFTMAEATRAGLVKPKSGWEKYPRSMLRARCTAELARIAYPDIVANCYNESEEDEIRASRQGGAA